VGNALKTAAIIGGPRTNTNGISVKKVKKKVDSAIGKVTGAPLRKAARNGGTVAAIMADPSNIPTIEPTSKLRQREFLKKTTGTRKIMNDETTTPINAIFVQKSSPV
jgi:hypothetical protein